MCNEAICLFLRESILANDFQKIVYDNYDEFENELDENVFFEIINTDFSSKQQMIHLKVVLYDYISTNFNHEYNKYSDAYIDKIVESNRNDAIALYLKEKYQKKDLLIVNLHNVFSSRELIDEIKKSLQYPSNSGNNWDAINDFIYDIIFPKELHITGWAEIQKRIPNDAKIMKSILDKVEKERCIVKYIE